MTAFLCAAITRPLLLTSVRASAQELEPRAYSNAPVGLNFLVTGFSYIEGGIGHGTPIGLDSDQEEV